MAVTVNTDTIPAASVAWIALGRLGVAEENVRRTDRRGDIEGLAASIAAEGLLQNLTGFQTETGRYRIVAGGRRLAALKSLAKTGRWSGPVPVRVLVSATDAKRVSLTENVMRRALHPADEFEAFAGLIAEGYDAAEVAHRFGTSVRHVEQRMKLAAVSPTLVKAYRAGAMTLDQLTAFAVVDDHARQVAAWTGRGGFRDLSPRAIRVALFSGHVPVTDKLVRFVGVEAYEAAGGGVVRDLFDDADGGAWLADAELLRRLAGERMKAEAEAVKAEGWAWVEVFESVPYCGFHAHGRVHPTPLPASDERLAELERLRAERDALEARAKVEPSEAAWTALERIDLAIAEQQRPECGYSPEDLQRAGCVIGLGHDGRVKIERGLIRPQDVRREAKAARAAEVAQAKRQGGVTETPSPALSDTLIEELTIQRTAALQAEVMRRPDLALIGVVHALALIGVVHALALPTFYGHAYSAPSCFELRASEVGFVSRVSDPACAASRVIDEAREAWGCQLPGDANALWGWLVHQPRDTVLELLAFLASGSINAVRRRHDQGPRRIAHADQLAQALGLDMTRWWAADETFLARLSKAQIVEAVSEGASPQAAAPLAKLSKAEAVRRAAKAMTGGSWLPSPLRTSALDERTTPDDDEQPGEDEALAA